MSNYAQGHLAADITNMARAAQLSAPRELLLKPASTSTAAFEAQRARARALRTVRAYWEGLAIALLAGA